MCCHHTLTSPARLQDPSGLGQRSHRRVRGVNSFPRPLVAPSVAPLWLPDWRNSGPGELHDKVWGEVSERMAGRCTLCREGAAGVYRACVVRGRGDVRVSGGESRSLPTRVQEWPTPVYKHEPSLLRYSQLPDVVSRVILAIVPVPV